MTTELKTMTLCAGQDDNPTWSICRGHVAAEVFSKAYNAEGWSGGEDISQSDLKFEYWVQREFGSWRKSTREDPKAEPVTVNEW